MDLERVVKNQTVIVRDVRIDDIGPASRIEIPEGAVLVDGVGKYLLPGLAEMPSVRQVNDSYLHHKPHLLPVSPSRRGSATATDAKF
jgi:alpha-D-ribose 1-methylphosphonate 5-triphosphate diphosphatase PhnM